MRVGTQRLALLMAAWVVGMVARAAVTPPAQPAEGPGGAQYAHRQVTAKLYGDDARAYWLFEPAAPQPEHAPLIVFNHGWNTLQPANYGAWIDHLVKRGNIVVYPIYQADLRTPVGEYTPNAIAAVQAALLRLAEPGHVKPEPEHVAVVGHSMGGVISANMAALCEKAGLPRPKALMCVQPGITWVKLARIAIKLEDMRAIPAETLLLSVVGDRDVVAGTTDAKRIFNETKHIPAENKNFVRLLSDDHGGPALLATHFLSIATNPAYTDPRFTPKNNTPPAHAEKEAAPATGIDALDYYGLWKLCDALMDAAFYQKNRHYALGNTPEQRHMGRWSDGTPVKELEVIAKP